MPTVYGQRPSGVQPPAAAPPGADGLYPTQLGQLPGAQIPASGQAAGQNQLTVTGQVNSQGISPGRVLATPGGHLRTGGPNPGFTNLGSLAGLYEERGRIY